MGTIAISSACDGQMHYCCTQKKSVDAELILVYIYKFAFLRHILFLATL